MSNITGAVAAYVGSVGGLYLNAPLVPSQSSGAAPIVQPVPPGGNVQVAIDATNGILSSSVSLPAGTFTGNLTVSNRGLAVSTNAAAIPPPGMFSIIGDPRPCAGVCFLQAGKLYNSAAIPGLGTNLADITLNSGVNSISVTLTAGSVDFGVLGVVAGDILKIRANDGVWYERTVISAVTNTISYSGGSLVVGGAFLISDGAQLVICPRTIVQASSTANNAAVFVAGSAVVLRGIWFNNKNVIAGLNHFLRHIESYVVVLNCLFDDALGNLSSQAVRGTDSFFTNSPNLGANTASTIICASNTNGMRHARGGVYIDGLTATSNAGLSAAIYLSEVPSRIVNLQLVNSAGLLVESENCIIDGPYLCFQNSRGVTATSSNVQILSGAINCAVNGGGVPIANSVAVTATLGATVGIYGTLLRNAALAISDSPVSKVEVETASNIIGCTNLYAVSATSVFSVGDVIGNVNIISTVGAVVFESAFTSQRISAAGASLITLNPGLQINGIPVFVGKTYVVSSTTAQAHTITLPGAFFFGAGTGTVATFSAAVGNYIVFTVLDAAVVSVTALSAGVTIA